MPPVSDPARIPVVRIDDPEHAQPVVAALRHPVVGPAGQHLLEMAEAEALPGAGDRGEQLLREHAGVGDARRVESVVAVGAPLGRVLAEVAEQ